MNKEKRVAVVPGSFDPITNGHLDIIKKAAVDFDEVYVAVMINPEKNYMFSLEERQELVESAVGGLKNTKVISSRGWLWELARDLNACAIVKGYRNETDLEYERKMAVFNEQHYPKGKTILIKSEEFLSNISSTLVREHINDQKSVSDFLPKAVIEKIQEIQSKKNSPTSN